MTPAEAMLQAMFLACHDRFTHRLGRYHPIPGAVIEYMSGPAREALGQLTAANMLVPFYVEDDTKTRERKLNSQMMQAFDREFLLL